MLPSLHACCSASQSAAKSSKRSLSVRRAASTFSYLKIGRAPSLVHHLVFDDNKRYEQWKSDTIPRVATPDVQIGVPKQERALYEKLVALVKQHPETFLIRAMLEKSKHNGHEFPLSESEVQPFLEPATDAEKQQFATLAGRVAAMQDLQGKIKGIVDLIRSSESLTLDAGVRDVDSPYSAAQTQAIERANDAHSAREGLKVLRQISIMHATALAQLSPEQRSVSEKSWLSSIGVIDPDAPGARRVYERSPRIPSEIAHAIDAPLDSHQTSQEVQDGPNYLDYEDSKLLAMEHRDRMEVGSRTALPSSLRKEAPNAELAQAAAALEANPSLSREDREYMLQFYADALSNKASGFDVSKEKAAFADPQPQWGFYDPVLPRVQDDAKDVLYGRGRFSEYRGSLFSSELTPPSVIGEAPIPGVGVRAHGEVASAGTAPEVVEEAAAHIQALAARMQRDSHAATAAVTTALERSMGLRPRNAGGSSKSGGDGSMPKPAHLREPSFWKKYAAGQRVHGSDPVAPVNQPYSEPERAPMPTATRGGAAAAAAGGKDAKGGKPGAKGGAAPAAAKKK